MEARWAPSVFWNTHVIGVQHSEELGVGDELHRWGLQQQGDFL